MSNTEITAVGIDVSKGKSTVAVRRPGGRIVMKPFTVLHTAEGLAELANTLRGIGGEIRVVMEHTGMYWRPVALTLKQSGFSQDRELCSDLLAGATGLLRGG